MSLSINSKKIIASVMALSIVASGVISSEASVFSKIVPTNTISASAAVVTSSDGNWEFKTTSNYTAEITGYKGQGGRVIVPEAVKDSSTNKSYTVTSFGSEVFRNNDKITSLTIPRGVSAIPDDMCCNTKNLTSVSLPHGIKTIGKYAFAYTPKLTSISLPNTLEKIDRFAFDKAALTSISFPSSLKTIESYAFMETNLTFVTLPSSLTSVGVQPFGYCSKLQTVTINCNLEFKNELFKDCNNLTNVNISSNCINKVLSSKALAGCSNLTKINNTQVVRHYYDGEPYFDSQYRSFFNQNFEKADINNLSFMNIYLNSMIKYVVKKETAGCTTKIEKVKKLHDWVCNKVDYAYKSNGEPEDSQQVHCDSSVFFRNTTVCDGYARALTLLLREAGIESYYLSSSSHAWCMVKLGNSYFHLDACHDDGNPIDYDHYLKSDNDIKKCSSGHSMWSITKPSSRFTYTVPSQLPECKWSLGDANMKNGIDKADVTTIQNYLLNNITLSESAKVLADANSDGKIDMSDAVYLIQTYPQCR